MRPALLAALAVAALFCALPRRNVPVAPQAFSPTAPLAGLLCSTVLGRCADPGPTHRLPRLAVRDQDLTPANGASLPMDVLEPVVAVQKDPTNSSSTAVLETTPAAATPAVVGAKKKAVRAESQGSASGVSSAPALAAARATAAQLDSAAVAAGGAASELWGAWATNAPSWAPFAAVGAVLLAVGLFVSNVLYAPTPERRAPAVEPRAAATVVRVQQAEAPAPKATLAPSPKPAPAPAPAAALPPAPVQAVPSVVPVAPAAPVLSEPGANWGKRLAGWLATGLRTAADRLPETELALELEAPVVESGLQWALEIRPENAGTKAMETMPVLGSAVAKGAEVVARTGLQLGAYGLNFVSEELPEAGQVAQATTIKALPTIQSGVRASADASRALASSAAELSKPAAWPSKVPQEVRQVVSKSPVALNAAASVLDTAATAAPGAENFAAYLAGKALPVVRALLESASEISADAASMPAPERVPLPEVKQVADAFRAVGVDPDQLASEARAKLSDVRAQLPDLSKAASDAMRQALGEPGGALAGTARGAEPAPKTAPSAAASKAGGAVSEVGAAAAAKPGTAAAPMASVPGQPSPASNKASAAAAPAASAVAASAPKLAVPAAPAP